MKPFVFVFFLGFGAWALGGCSPSNGGNHAADDNPAQGNAAVSNAAIVPSTNATPTPSERASLVSNVWVPGKDDKLHLQPVSKAALDAQKKFGDPTAALADIVRMAPAYFPPKTRVLQWHDDGKTVSVNLNRNFASGDFWSQSGETATRLAVYALVNSAAIGGKPVVLKVEMRPIETLGEMDTSDAIEPDGTLGSTALSATPKTKNKTASQSSGAAKTGSPRATTSPAINALPDADFSSPKTGSTPPGKTNAQ